MGKVNLMFVYSVKRIFHSKLRHNPTNSNYFRAILTIISGDGRYSAALVEVFQAQKPAPPVCQAVPELPPLTKGKVAPTGGWATADDATPATAGKWFAGACELRFHWATPALAGKTSIALRLPQLTGNLAQRALA